MGNCNNYDLGLASSVKDIEGKPLKDELACAVIGKWEGVRSFCDSPYGVLKSLRECESTQWTAFVIAITRGSKFGASVRGET